MSESDSEDSSRERIRYKTENTRNISENYNQKESISSSGDESNHTEVIGPSLPPHLAKSESEDSQEACNIGPILPPHMIKKSDQELSVGPSKQSEVKSFGPSLPLHLKKQLEEKSDEDSNESVLADRSSEVKSCGPSLPLHLKKLCEEKSDEDSNESVVADKSSEVKSFGPSLPLHLKKQLQEKSDEDSNESVVKSFGPSLPDHLRKQLESQSEDVEFGEEVYGPLPAGMSGNSSASIALEERALQMQIEKITPKENPQTVRESWMLELPEVKAANLGLGPRQFRNKAGPDMSDRSSWTNIGVEKGKEKKKEKPLDLKAEAELKELRKRDKEQELQAKKHKRKSKSLVAMHEDKIKKKKNDSPSTTERKPFSRETDLQVNKFDEAQKKAVLKKAQLLDTRFSSGKSKFL